LREFGTREWPVAIRDRAYLAEQHRDDRNFRTLNNSEQPEYWDGRRKNSDRK
jgi:hypothetical protein